MVSLYSLITKESMTIREMGEILGLNYKKVSYLIGKLEKKGYIRIVKEKRVLLNGKVVNKKNYYEGIL